MTPIQILTLLLVIEAIIVVGIVLLYNHKINELISKTQNVRSKGTGFPVPECQFCGTYQGVTKTVDGYFACKLCKITKLNQTA